MSELYKSIEALCASRGIKPGKMCNDLGISRSLMTDLRAGRKNGVNAATAQKIAAYFGVTVDRLLGTEKEPAAEDGELWEYLQMLKDNPGLKVLLDHSKHASREDIEAIVRVLGLGGKNEN